MRQSVGVCRQVCSGVSAGSDACYVRTPYDDKSTKEIATLLSAGLLWEALPARFAEAIHGWTPRPRAPYLATLNPGHRGSSWQVGRSGVVSAEPTGPVG